MARRHRTFRLVFTNLLVAIPLVTAVGYVAFRDRLFPATEATLRLSAGQALPAVRLADARGGVALLPALLAGRPGAVAIVHPMCMHCHSEIRILSELLAGMPAATRPGLALVSVGDAVQTDRLRATFPEQAFWLDIEGSFVREHGLQAVPVLLLVDGGGTVRTLRGGAQDRDALRALLATLASAEGA